LTDALGTEWKNELIHKPISFPAGQLVKPDARVRRSGDGTELTSQVTDVERHDDGSIRSMKVWFFADVPANGTVSYSITPGQKGKTKKAYSLVRIPGGWELHFVSDEPVVVRSIE